jgi:hypothetical protein
MVACPLMQYDMHMYSQDLDKTEGLQYTLMSTFQRLRDVFKKRMIEKIFEGDKIRNGEKTKTSEKNKKKENDKNESKINGKNKKKENDKNKNKTNDKNEGKGASTGGGEIDSLVSQFPMGQALPDYSKEVCR